MYLADVSVCRRISPIANTDYSISSCSTSTACLADDAKSSPRLIVKKSSRESGENVSLALSSAMSHKAWTSLYAVYTMGVSWSRIQRGLPLVQIGLVGLHATSIKYR